MSLTKRLTAVQQGIRAACEQAGREPESVRLIAVSKVHPTASIIEARACGQLDFGESFAQELRDKARQLPDVHWHFIGRIQRNKCKYISPVATRVHALEQVAQAEALAARAAGPLKCLMAVNIGEEPQKSGVLPTEVVARAESLHAVDGIELVGLMCLPPQREDPEDVAPFFEHLAHLAGACRSHGLPVTELSMGMSHDYAVAIRHGATWVRVGTAVFGPRPTTR